MQQNASVSWDMMSKNDDYPPKVAELQQSVEELDIGIKAIVEEHDRFSIKGSEKEIWSWFGQFPIESLRESLDFDLKRKRSRYSLKDMKYKFHLRKMHEKVNLQLEEKKNELQLAKIDHLLARIEGVQNEQREQSGKSVRRSTKRKKASG